ncbi:MAG: sulfatase [Verrucomicrobia bacterium]|nr:sulfatase [Verrucomicrobiota bacterium]
MKQTRKIVFIMTDTQRTDMLGCYGNAGMKTPCLDRLAGQGIRFDKAYTCQPVCGPARAAIFTGTWPHNNGSWGNSMALGDNVKTIGQRLRDNGLHTAYIGKWHLDGSDYFGLGRCPDGWDMAYWYDMRNYLEELSVEERALSRKTIANKAPGVQASFTYGHRCSNRAIDFLDKHGSEDFFLVVSYDEPHGPYLCPKPYSEMYNDYKFPVGENVRDTLADKPAHQKAWAGNRLAEDRTNHTVKSPAFFGCNSFVDSEIGRVIEAVDRHAPDALVIYTSDHGDALDAHRIYGKGPAMYDEITRIPFIVRWPGSSPEGTVCPHPVSHIDLVPTILEAAGIPIPKSVDGRSMLRTFVDPASKPQETIFMEFGRYEIDHDGFGGFQPVRAAFDGRFKLVVNLLTTDELYDLNTDPGEMKNLIDSPDRSTIRNKLHDSILNWMNTSRDPFRGYYWERRPWRTDARPATWDYTEMTRQRENEEYEPRQLDYSTGLPMIRATRSKDVVQNRKPDKRT